MGRGLAASMGVQMTVMMGSNLFDMIVKACFQEGKVFLTHSIFFISFHSRKTIDLLEKLAV